MNVLFLTFDGLTDPLGQSQVLPYLAGLSGKGHAITVLSSEKKENFEKNNAGVSALVSKAGIRWKHLDYSRSIPFVSQRLTIQKMKRMARALVKEYKIETLHCRSYLSALIGLEFKRKYGTKFIFDMRGFWADERIDGGIWKMSNPLHKAAYRYFKKKEIDFFRNADQVISLTYNAKKEFESWPELHDAKIPVQVIPCCVDLDHFSAKKIKTTDQETLRKESGIHENDFVISYLGSLGTWYMLDEMMDFFVVLRREKKNALFLVISNDNEEAVYRLCDKKGLPRSSVVVKGATRARVPLFLSLSRISVYFIRPAYSKKASSPTKLGEILSMGIPVISNPGIGDSDEIIGAKGAGILVREFNKEAYEQAVAGIDNVVDKPADFFTGLASEFFSLERGVELYEEVYRKIQKL